MKDYKTVSSEGTAEIVERKSRFIASVRPVRREEEAIGFINTVRAAHRDASHNVYAYICRENNTQRYSDDGEPAGTAGIPVLEVLKKEGLTDICVVVTRYFGGTLLGAGGLVRAYGKSAGEGVRAAGIITMVYSDIFTVETDYSLLGRLQHEISANGYITLESDYGERVMMKLCTEAARGAELLAKLTEASNGRAVITKTGQSFVANPLIRP